MCRYKGSYYYCARSVPPTINSTLEDKDDCDDNGGDAYFDGDVDDIEDKNNYDCQ